MAKGKLFEYAILFHPKTTKKMEDDGVEAKSEILVQPKTVLADGPDQVSILAAREIDGKYLDKLDQVEIVVRPF